MIKTVISTLTFLLAMPLSGLCHDSTVVKCDTTYYPYFHLCNTCCDLSVEEHKRPIKITCNTIKVEHENDSLRVDTLEHWSYKGCATVHPNGEKCPYFVGPGTSYNDTVYDTIKVEHGDNKVYKGTLRSYEGTIRKVEHEDNKNLDTVSLPLQCVDYLGFPLPTDRFTIAVVGPDGDVVFSDSGDLGVKGMRLDHYKGLPYYCYYRAIDDIDGAGKPGWYLLVIESHNDSAGIPTSNRLPFEIVEHSRYYLMTDSTLEIATYSNDPNPVILLNTNYRLVTLPREVDSVVCRTVTDTTYRSYIVRGYNKPEGAGYPIITRRTICDTTWKDPVIRLEEIKE